MRDIVVIGSGGHTNTVVDTIEKEGNYNVKAIICDFGKPGLDMLGYNLRGNLELLKENILPQYGIVAIGDSYYREQNVEKIKTLCPNFKYVQIVHPLSDIGKLSQIGFGSVVQAGAVLRNQTQVGMHCHINSNCSIGHNTILDDFITIGFNVSIGGFAKIGKGAVINMGACLRDRLEVGEYAVVGMGSVVTKDVPPYTVVYGSPAKVIRERVKTDGFLG